MPQSLARLHIHLIFSTKHRERLIDDEVRDALHRYMAVVLQNFACPATIIGSVEDHIHILVQLSRTLSVSQVVEHVKTTSSKWIKTQGDRFAQFAWQSGYAAFAVSESGVEAARTYIAGQREHHQTRTFQDEDRVFLERNSIAFDERYVWD